MIIIEKVLRNKRGGEEENWHASKAMDFLEYDLHVQTMHQPKNLSDFCG